MSKVIIRSQTMLSTAWASWEFNIDRLNAAVGICIYGKAAYYRKQKDNPEEKYSGNFHFVAKVGI